MFKSRGKATTMTSKIFKRTRVQIQSKLGYNVKKGAEYFVSLQASVVITE
jgi:hypothetical protein